MWLQPEIVAHASLGQLAAALAGQGTPQYKALAFTMGSFCVGCILLYGQSNFVSWRRAWRRAWPQPVRSPWSERPQAADLKTLSLGPAAWAARRGGGRAPAPAAQRVLLAAAAAAGAWRRGAGRAARHAHEQVPVLIHGFRG